MKLYAYKPPPPQACDCLPNITSRAYLVKLKPGSSPLCQLNSPLPLSRGLLTIGVQSCMVLPNHASQLELSLAAARLLAFCQLHACLQQAYSQRVKCMSSRVNFNISTVVPWPWPCHAMREVLLLSLSRCGSWGG